MERYLNESILARISFARRTGLSKNSMKLTGEEDYLRRWVMLYLYTNLPQYVAHLPSAEKVRRIPFTLDVT